MRLPGDGAMCGLHANDKQNQICNCTAKPGCLTAKEQLFYLGMSKATIAAAVRVWRRP